MSTTINFGVKCNCKNEDIRHRYRWKVMDIIGTLYRGTGCSADCMTNQVVQLRSLLVQKDGRNKDLFEAVDSKELQLLFRRGKALST